MDEFRTALDRWTDRIVAARTIAKAIIDARAGHMTPAEIAKLTDQATRAKALMVKSAASGEKAKAVFDSYEATLAKFDANVAQVKANDQSLNSVLATMGNAEVVLDAAFQADAPPTPTNGSGGAAPGPLAPTA